MRIQDRPVTVTRATRRLVYVKCANCSYERLIDTSLHPGINPTNAINSGTLHCREQNHEVYVHDVKIHRYRKKTS